MNKNLKVSKNIIIDTSADKLWKVLTDPEIIKVYLYGTQTITDWQLGSPIVFQGEYQGNLYKDKGNVLENIRNQILSYDYWSGFSGLSDSPENYAEVTYSIQKLCKNQVRFTWSQIGYANEEGQKHSENGLSSMLEQIKNLAEEL
tara:strand:- start:154 stop:588 length:435 start_codon:yes stop_codon:yes gene_type:complete